MVFELEYYHVGGLKPKLELQAYTTKYANPAKYIGLSRELPAKNVTHTLSRVVYAVS